MFLFATLKMSQVFVHILNFMGILNLKKTKGKSVYKVSKFQYLGNVVKVCLLVWFRHDIFKLFIDNFASHDANLKFSSFTDLLFHSYYDVQVTHFCFTVIIQLLKCRKMATLFNKVETLRQVIFLQVEGSKTQYKEFQRGCWKNILIVVTATIAVNVYNAWRTMRFTLVSFLSFSLIAIPLCIKLGLFCFVYFVLNFFIFCQKCLKSLIIENSETIPLLLYEICNLKSFFFKTLNLALFEVIFYFMSSLVFQVRKTLYLNKTRNEKLSSSSPTRF